MSGQSSRVSVCIVNWNTRDLLRDCLESVFRDKERRASLEVIVVDNASTDDSVEMVRGMFPQVRLLVNEENVGFAGANNRAFEMAEGRYLLLLNSDTIVLPGAVDEMVRFMEAHPDAGIAGCKLLNADGSLQPSCRSFPNLWILLLRALHLDRLFPDTGWAGANYMSHWNHNSVREVDVVQGSFMMVRREVLEDAGPLDEGFFMYSEETDWCYRARQKGWKTYFNPEAQIIHLGGQSSRRQPAKMTIIYHRSLQQYFRKHHGPLASLAVRLLGIVEVASRLVYWTVNSLVRRGKKERAGYKIGVYWPTLRWLVTGRTAWRP